MYILVTGGAGYMVVILLEHYREKFKVVVLDNLVYGHKEIVEKILKVPLIVGDIGNKELVMKIISGQHPKTNGEKIMAVVHFAAYAYVGESVIEPLKYYKNNVKESISFLEAIVQESLNRSNWNDKIAYPIVFSSSCNIWHNK